MRKFTDQRGIAHVVEIIIIAVVVLGAGGFIAWRVWEANQKSPESALQQAVANAQCAKLNDQDLCKFLTSWKQSGSYKVTSSQTVSGQTTTSTYESSNNGADYHMSMTIDGKPYEIIGIGTTLYTKDQGSGTWWKQTLEQDKEGEYKGGYQYDFEDPSTASDQPVSSEPQYKKIGTEACGNKTCFKYQVIDPATPDDTQYIWFDNKEYQLQRMRTESKGGTVSDQTFAYGNVSISAPSPTKDLPANTYIVPGQSEPQTMPDMQDLQDQLNAAE